MIERCEYRITSVQVPADWTDEQTVEWCKSHVHTDANDTVDVKYSVVGPDVDFAFDATGNKEGFRDR